MPRPELPHAVPFTVDRLGLTFTDRRYATAEEDDLARHGFRTWTIREWNERQPVERRDCNDHLATRKEIARRWDEWIAQNPDGDRDQFEQEGLTVVDETCEDPRLPRLDLVARNPLGHVVGMLSLYNLTTLREEEGVLVVRAMPMPGFPPALFGSIPEGWGVCSRWLLENDIDLADGSVIVVEELFFPEDDDSHSMPENDNGMSEMWAEILSASEVEEPSKREGVPKRVKRTG